MASLSSESQIARLEPVHDVRAQDLPSLDTVKKGPGPGNVPSAAEQLTSEAPPSSPHGIPISVQQMDFVSGPKPMRNRRIPARRSKIMHLFFGFRFHRPRLPRP